MDLYIYIKLYIYIYIYMLNHEGNMKGIFQSLTLFMEFCTVFVNIFTGSLASLNRTITHRVRSWKVSTDRHNGIIIYTRPELYLEHDIVSGTNTLFSSQRTVGWIQDEYVQIGSTTVGIARWLYSPQSTVPVINRSFQAISARRDATETCDSSS